VKTGKENGEKTRHRPDQKRKKTSGVLQSPIRTGGRSRRDKGKQKTGKALQSGLADPGLKQGKNGRSSSLSLSPESAWKEKV